MSTTLGRNAIHQKRHQLRKLRGETAYIDATAARLHIASLRAAGWSMRSIAGTATVPVITISRIGRGLQANATPKTLTRILAVDPDTIATTSAGNDDPFVSRVGTVRRLQALMVLGWTHAAMTEHCGHRTAVLLHQQGQWVTRSTHDDIAAMYHDLAHKAGPSTRTASRARKLGHAGPMDWHDIDRDSEPDRDVTEPEGDDLDQVAIERRMAGDKSIRLSKAEQVALVEQWHATGRGLNELERITGINPHRLRRKEAA